jgi:hypothetical protein
MRLKCNDKWRMLESFISGTHALKKKETSISKPLFIGTCTLYENHELKSSANINENLKKKKASQIYQTDVISCFTPCFLYSGRCYISFCSVMKIYSCNHFCAVLRINQFFNPFTAEVGIMRLLGSAPKSHLCDQRRRGKATNLSDLMTLFIDLGCLYCKQTQRAFKVFKNTLNSLKIDSADKKLNWLECGNFSQDAGTSGIERVIAFSQMAVKG